MSSNDRATPDMVTGSEFSNDTEELIALVDGAVKALSIGGPLQSADAVRQTVDCLKHQFGSGSGSE